MSDQPQSPYAPPTSRTDGPLAVSPAVTRPDGFGPTPAIIAALAGTRPWTLFLAIVGFISAGLIGLGAIAVFIGAAVAGGVRGGSEMGVLIGLGAVYLICCGLYVFISIVLVRYPVAIGRLLESHQVADLEEALDTQRAFWKTIGITIIVGFGMAVLGAIAAIVVAVLTSGAHNP